MCIAGVADQLQTNFAADLRQILRSVFLINCTPDEPEIIDETKSKDNQQDLFEFRASEENVIRQSNSNQGSIGSQQSICSAEEANPESDDAVFEENEEEEEEEKVGIIETRDDNEVDRSRKRRYGNRLNGRSISLSDDASTTSNANRNDEEHHTTHRNYSISTSPSTSHPQSPPKWIPDHEAPKCMNCESQFTAFRRRHHCRACGEFKVGIRFKKNIIFGIRLNFTSSIFYFIKKYFFSFRWNLLRWLLIIPESFTEVRTQQTRSSLSSLL